MSNSKISKDKLIRALKQSALTGLGFGVAIANVHLVIGIVLIITLGMPPLTWFAGKTLLIEIPLAVAVGLLLFGLQLLKGGRFIQPAVMAIIWIILEWTVAVDPAKLQMWLAPTLVAGGIYFGFRWVWHKKPAVVLAIAVGAPLVVLAVPLVHYKLSGGYDVPEVKEAKAAPKGAPDVVFVVVDTVRAQNVSAYGYERNTTPVFDKFAAEGALFEQATAPATWSLPAHAALFTGTLPSFNNAHGETRILDDKLPTLAEALAKAGWETRCFTANPHISSGFGLTRGFGWSDNAWLTGAGGRGFTFIYRLIDSLGVSAQDKGGALVVSNVKDWMAQRPKGDKPAFVFVNFLEAHFPFHQLPDQFRNMYTQKPLSELRHYGQLAFGAQMGRQLTPDEQNAIRQPILDLYDGGIAYTDYLLGEIIDTWRQRGTLDNTVFVVLGDHGELVGEHDSFGHLSAVYEEALRVPFLLRYPPKIAGQLRVKQEISTLGVFGTIFDLLDLAPPETLQVGSLMPALKAPDATASTPAAFGRPVMAERFEEHLLSARFKPGTANGKGPLLSPWGRYRTYRTGDLKLVKHFKDGAFLTYLFDLAADPGELTDLAATRTADVQQLEQELKNWEILLKLPSLDGTPPPAQQEGTDLSDEAKEQLKALGYIGD